MIRQWYFEIGHPMTEISASPCSHDCAYGWDVLLFSGKQHPQAIVDTVNVVMAVGADVAMKALVNAGEEIAVCGPYFAAYNCQRQMLM